MFSAFRQMWRRFTCGLLRFRAARDGVLVYEERPGIFDRFRFEAARFWYDAEPVLRSGYEALLDRLG